MRGRSGSWWRRGQAHIEYAVVTGMVVAALLGGAPGPMEELTTAVTNLHKGYAFAVTRPVIVPDAPVGLAIASGLLDCAGSPSACDINDLTQKSALASGIDPNALTPSGATDLATQYLEGIDPMKQIANAMTGSGDAAGIVGFVFETLISLFIPIP